MTLTPLRLLPFCVLFGCLAAPREVETTIELGPQKVEIAVRLKDIRTTSADELNQLLVFQEFAVWNPEWTRDLAWAPTPARFEYSSDGGRLELAMHGSMSRADFERCARAAADAGVCPEFPLELGKAGWAVRPEVLGLKSLIIDGKQRSSWPADAGRIGYRVGLSAASDQFIAEGPSLARGFGLHAEPEKAKDTVGKIDAAEKTFVQGSVADWLKELTLLEACTEQPWCALRREAARRDQARLVHGYLRPRPEAGAALREPPARHLDVFSAGFSAILPKDLLPPIDELRLRVRFDVLLDSFREEGQLGWEPNPWASVCRPETMKKPSLKDFCARLGVRGKR